MQQLIKLNSRSTLKRFSLLTLIVFASLIMVNVIPRQWFFYDEWTLFLHRDLRFNDLMVPHNGHWSAVPFFVDLLLFKIFQFSSYIPYLLTVTIANLLLCTVMYKTLRLNGVVVSASLLASSLLIAPAVGFENLLWAFQLGYMSSMLFGTLAFLVASRRTKLNNKDGFSIGILLSASIASSGIGIVFVISLGIFLIQIKQRVRVMAFAIGIPSISYAAWFIVFGESGVQGPISSAPEIFKFMWFGISNSIKNGLLLTEVGPGFLFALIALLLVSVGTYKNKRGMLFGLTYLLTGVLFYLLTAFSRASFGVEYAASYRYMHIFFIFFIPLVSIVFESLFSKWKIFAIVTIVGTSFILIDSGRILIQRAEGQAAQEADSQRSLASANYLQNKFSNSIISARPLDQFAPQVSYADLDFMSRNDAFDGIILNGDDIAYGLLSNGVSIEPATAIDEGSAIKCMAIDEDSSQLVSSISGRFIEVKSFDKMELYPNIEASNLRPFRHYESQEILAGDAIRVATSDFTWTVKNSGLSPIEFCYFP